MTLGECASVPLCVLAVLSALSIGLILIGGNHLLRSSPRISFTFRRDVREIAPGVRGCTATDVRSGILMGKRWKIWDLSGRDRREGPE